MLIHPCSLKSPWLIDKQLNLKYMHVISDTCLITYTFCAHHATLTTRHYLWRGLSFPLREMSRPSGVYKSGCHTRNIRVEPCIQIIEWVFYKLNSNKRIIVVFIRPWDCCWQRRRLLDNQDTQQTLAYFKWVCERYEEWCDVVYYYSNYGECL